MWSGIWGYFMQMSAAEVSKGEVSLPLIIQTGYAIKDCTTLKHSRGRLVFKIFS
jgi:hypothetical protein